MKNAPSAGNPSRSNPSFSTPRQSVLPGVATHVTNSLSSHVKRETPLVDGLKLGIRLIIDEDRQWLRMNLEDEMNLIEVSLLYPILCPTLDRRYHLREATVIGLRRLVQMAFDQGLISDSPGELMITQKSLPTPSAPTLMPSEEDDFAQSLTDLGSL